MRITAALAWHDEPVGFLERCVLSLGALVDEVVAVDGAWKWFDGSVASAPEEARAIDSMARWCGIPARVIIPTSIFESQVHKRAFLMEEAAKNSDWVLVIDADEYIAECDIEVVHERLAQTNRDVGAVQVTNLHRGERLPDDYHPDGGLRRRFYRAGTTVVVVHSGYSYQGKHLLPGEPELDLSDCLKIDHDIANRGAERNQKARDYREARTRERVEVWV